eukprot:c11302_g1_i1.p1 GENE.c11302_g1_i1~~c11302_g1_i1.p1  ORF type:complete len:421 (-),score=116.79 c11302_g1_i1:185-1447(-)
MEGDLDIPKRARRFRPIAPTAHPTTDSLPSSQVTSISSLPMPSVATPTGSEDRPNAARAFITPFFKAPNPPTFSSFTTSTPTRATTSTDKDCDRESVTSSTSGSSRTQSRSKKRGPEPLTQEAHELAIKDVIRACKRRGKTAPPPKATTTQTTTETDLLQPPENVAPTVEIIGGEIVLSEDALYNSNIEDHSAFDRIDESAVAINSRSYSNWTKGDRWSTKETAAFYQALRVCGSDFSVMEKLFPTRNRRQLRNKFKREEKTNPDMINRAMLAPRSITSATFNEILGKPMPSETLAAVRAPRDSNSSVNNDGEEVVGNLDFSDDDNDNNHDVISNDNNGNRFDSIASSSTSKARNASKSVNNNDKQQTGKLKSGFDDDHVSDSLGVIGADGEIVIGMVGDTNNSDEEVIGMVGEQSDDDI